MTLSSKDVEEIEKKPIKEPRGTGLIIGFIRLLGKIPFISRRLNNSMGGMAGRIFNCWEREDYKRATEISIEALERFKDKQDLFGPDMSHHHWWSFMKYGVDSATNIEDKDLKEKLITMANHGMKPFEGYSVAYSFLQFSRWKYSENKYDVAIKYAKTASEADSTWAEPEFILGWYALLLSKGDAEEHLSKAVERDQRLLFRIANNDVCKQYPHIIIKLKEKYSEVGDISSPNNGN